MDIIKRPKSCIADPKANTSRGPWLSIIPPKTGPQAKIIKSSVEDIHAISDGEVLGNAVF
jgi:hypothetical protein